MAPIVVAIFAILLGAMIRSFGPSLGRAGNAGSARLVGYGFMVAGLVLAASNTFAVISVGEVGVQHFLGSISPTLMTAKVLEAARARPATMNP